MSKTPSKSFITSLPYLICGLGSLFYVYDFVIRVLPGTITRDLMAQYAIGSAKLGIMSSFFYTGYMLMQIPSGMLYDRFGPRRLLAMTCFIAAVSTYAFMATDFFSIAIISRFMMGFGSAFAYIGALVLASRWLDKKYYALAAGLIQLMGSVGAMIGEAPIAELVKEHGSHYVTNAIAIIGIVLSFMFAVMIKDYPAHMEKLYVKKYQKGMLQRLGHVAIKQQSWAVALFAFGIWAPISVFAELWAVPFLADRFHESTIDAAMLASAIWAGVAVGGPFYGWLSNYIFSRKIPLLIGSSIGIVSSIFIIYFDSASEMLILVALFLLGTAGSVQAVTFGLVQDNNLPDSVGTAAGFNNMAIVIGGVIFQPIAGILLQLHWKGAVSAGVPVYSLSDFKFSLVVMPVCFLLSFLTALFLIRETNCKLQYKLTV